MESSDARNTVPPRSGAGVRVRERRAAVLRQAQPAKGCAFVPRRRSEARNAGSFQSRSVQAVDSQDDPRGPESPYLRTILRTHWVRTALITVSALLLLASVVHPVS